MAFTFGQNKMYIWKNNVITDSSDITNDLKISFKSASTIPLDGLVAYYPFNGNANDESGNNNNGTTNGGLTWVVDRFNHPGKAANFNGTSSYINVLVSSSLQIQSDITLSVWVTSSASQNNKVIVEKYYGNLNDHGWLLETMTDGQPVFEGRDGRGGSSTIKGSGGDINDNKWHLIVGQRSGNIWKIYIDGQHINETNVEGTAGSIESGGDLRIGASKYSVPMQFWNGNIDDIRIYKRALSDTEIQALYTEVK